MHQDVLGAEVGLADMGKLVLDVQAVHLDMGRNHYKSYCKRNYRDFAELSFYFYIKPDHSDFKLPDRLLGNYWRDFYNVRVTIINPNPN